MVRTRPRPDGESCQGKNYEYSQHGKSYEARCGVHERSNPVQGFRSTMPDCGIEDPRKLRHDMARKHEEQDQKKHGKQSRITQGLDHV